MEKTISLFFIVCFTLVLQAQNQPALSKYSSFGAIEEQHAAIMDKMTREKTVVQSSKVPSTTETVSKTVNVTTAGKLSTAFTAYEKTTVTDLTVTGTIDARDFTFMRDTLSMLSVLDISGVTVTAYIGIQGTIYGNNTYLANAIPQNAFYSSIKLPKLIRLTIPNSIFSIGKDAFVGCSGLTELIVQNASLNYSSVNGVLFNKNQDTLIAYPGGKQGAYTIPNTVNSIGLAAFGLCNGLTSVEIPNSVNSIGWDAFTHCTGLTGSLIIPSSVTSIGYFSFNGCSGLTEFIVQNGNLNYSVTNGVLFNKSQDTLISFPCGKQGIYVIPNSVTSIGFAAFASCFRLTSVMIPNSVTYIDDCAFADCSGLISIYETSTKPVSIKIADETSVFNGVNKSTCILYVPKDSKAAYQASDQWKNFANIVEMTTTLPTLKDNNINLYPNIVTDIFHITGLTGNVRLQMVDLNGRVVMSKQVSNGESVSISLLPQGLYIVKLITDEGVLEQKVMKK